MNPATINAKNDPYTRRLDIIIQPCGRLVIEEFVEGFSARGWFGLDGGRWM